MGDNFGHSQTLRLGVLFYSKGEITIEQTFTQNYITKRQHVTSKTINPTNVKLLLTCQIFRFEVLKGYERNRSDYCRRNYQWKCDASLLNPLRSHNAIGQMGKMQFHLVFLLTVQTQSIRLEKKGRPKSSLSIKKITL